MNTRHDDRYEDDPTPSRTAVERYRAVVRQDDAEANLALVHYRGGDEEFRLGLEYSQSADPLDRAVGADILAQLGWSDQTFLEETVDVLISLLADSDPYVVYCAATGLGHRADNRAIPHLVRLANHEDPLIRYGVVYGLSGREDPDAIASMIRLTADDDHDVRNWAVFGIGSQIDQDSPEIRDALWSALKDPDMEVRGDALVGLANRKDPRARAAILEEWKHDEISILSIEAAEELADPDLLESLHKLQYSFDIEQDSYCRSRLLGAVTACEGRLGDAGLRIASPKNWLATSGEEC